MTASLDQQAQSLLARLASQCHHSDGAFGSMSPSVYDTAWLSMIRDRTQQSTPNEASEIAEDDASQWLFPECFDFILHSQRPSGAWESYASPVDGILNTAAALLAIRKHMRAAHIGNGNEDLADRCERAEKALGVLLENFDSSAVDQVGFEILIIQHLELLEAEGVTYLRTPSLDALKHIRREKLTRLPPASVQNVRSTLHHSLEAFVGGEVDYDKLARWLEPNGSMMGSPSSTAAYLMQASSWDESAVGYLRNVVRDGPGGGDGSVPCAWPTSVFEVTWAVATLLDVGVKVDESSSVAISQFLKQTLEKGNGIAGFAPGSLPDVDDTAKATISLNGLGQQPGVGGLLAAFETKDHFRTYPHERNPSVTANCHVLTCLLQSSDPLAYVPQISKAATFLTERVFVGEVQDKWNRSEFYWIMLLAEAYKHLYSHPEVTKKLFQLSPHLQHDIPIVVLHLFKRVLLQQNGDGAWGGCETTSYAILALSAIGSLPCVRQQHDTSLEVAAARGKIFLLLNRDKWSCGEYIWVEKVNYASKTLSEVYCLAAALVQIPSNTVNYTIPSPAGHAHQIPEKLYVKMKKAEALVSRTPLAQRVSRRLLQIAETQACYFLMSTTTQERLSRIFTDNNGEERDGSYQYIIALAFTTCMATDTGRYITLSLLREMMLLSDLNFLVDEYMERMIVPGTTCDAEAVTKVINRIFEHVDGAGASENGTASQTNGHPPAMLEVLSCVVRYVLHHDAVAKSPQHYRQRLSFELKTFLLAHVAQAVDNQSITSQLSLVANGHENGSGKGVVPHEGNGEVKANGNGVEHNGSLNGDAVEHTGQRPAEYKQAGRTFYNWVRNTSADHTSCPFSFVFFNSLLYTSSQGKCADVFGSARTAYLAEDLYRHLATLCRMENDYGSLRRDMKECNLNSLNFSEFARASAAPEDGIAGEQMLTKMKSELLWLAQYERRGLEIALTYLLEESEAGCRDLLESGLSLFVNVTCLFGQIYILKDVGLRVK
ncbi:hypothetical protein F5Y16DRAFT_405936 [Xylariaceae sp. FL0255]|nr:hypothetical protein F5Y16DRAFT_405936 [Xylariaceae sp. FL0255]